MLCPTCRSTNTSTYNSRARQASIKRLRVCHDCATRFTTYEIPVGPNSQQHLAEILEQHQKSRKHVDSTSVPEVSYVPNWLRRQKRAV